MKPNLLGEDELVKVTPITRTPVDDDFGWTSLKEQTGNRVHDTMIPSSGFYFKNADTMPDQSCKSTSGNH